MGSRKTSVSGGAKKCLEILRRHHDAIICSRYLNRLGSTSSRETTYIREKTARCDRNCSLDNLNRAMTQPPSASFGAQERGFRVGQNYGSISKAFHLPPGKA